MIILIDAKKKKKKKKKPKKKTTLTSEEPNGTLNTKSAAQPVNEVSIDPHVYPPPVSKQFLNGVYPMGELQDYKEEYVSFFT